MQYVDQFHQCCQSQSMSFQTSPCITVVEGQLRLERTVAVDHKAGPKYIDTARYIPLAHCGTMGGSAYAADGKLFVCAQELANLQTTCGKLHAEILFAPKRQKPEEPRASPGEPCKLQVDCLAGCCPRVPCWSCMLRAWVAKPGIDWLRSSFFPTD